MIKEDTVLHAVPSSTTAITHNFLEQSLRLYGYFTRGRIVNRKILVRNSAQLMDMKCGQKLKIKNWFGLELEFGREEDIVLISLYLTWSVCGGHGYKSLNSLEIYQYILPVKYMRLITYVLELSRESRLAEVACKVT